MFRCLVIPLFFQSRRVYDVFHDHRYMPHLFGISRHVYTCLFKVVLTSRTHLCSIVSQLYKEINHIGQNILEKKVIR